MFCDGTDQPASPTAGSTNHTDFSLIPSLAQHVRLWGRGGVGKGALPGAWERCGALNQRSTERSANRFVSHTLVPEQGRHAGMIGGQEESREAGWLVAGRLVTGGGRLFVSKAGNTADSRDIVKTADTDRNSGRRCWLRLFQTSLLLWLRTNRQQNNSPRRDTRDFPAVKVPPASPGVEVDSVRRIQTILI